MKRFCCIVLALTLALTSLAGCGSKQTEDGKVKPELNIILAHNQTSLENPYSIAAIKFKEALEEVSGGRATATLHHGTLGENESELVEKLEMGAIHLAVASPGFMTLLGANEIDIFSLLYLFDSFDHWEACVDGEFGQEISDLLSERLDNRFKIMGYWTASVRDYYGKKPVVTPADLKGMTIRTQTTPVVQEFWKNCGAIPTNIAWGELYQALSQGVVDCSENDYTNFSLKEHHKTNNGKYVSETHHDYTTRLFLTTGQFYNALTEEQRGWFDEACRIATEENRRATYEMFEESKEKVRADGAQITEFQDIDIDAFKAIAIPIQDKFAAENGMERYLEMVRKEGEALKQAQAEGAGTEKAQAEGAGTENAQEEEGEHE